MKKSATYFSILFIMPFSQIYAQNIKGFYVNGFNTILGNTLKEDSLLIFAKNNGFNYLTLYDVHLINNSTPLTNVTTAQTFANFINKAKTQFNIAEIGVAAENYWFFSNIINVYNLQHPSLNEKVDVYNFEFEFWINSSVTTGAYYCTTYLQPNGFTCDTAGAFAFHKKELKKIDSLANSTGQKSEAYFGWFNAGQGKQIVQTGVDRILLSIYIPTSNYSPAYQYNYVKTRLQYLATAETNIKILPIYSAEPSFMQTWLNSNMFFLPYSDLSSSLTAETGVWKTYIEPEGIQWFAYSYLPKINMTTIESNDNKNEIKCYFANENIKIETNQQFANTTILITNTLGNTIYSLSSYDSIITINTSKFNEGIYCVTIKNYSTTLTKKIIVN